MAWTAPMTAVANATFTAAQFNTHVRDNLNETAPAKATTEGSLFVATGANSIGERIPGAGFVTTAETTTSSTFTDLTTSGPSVTRTTSGGALIIVGGLLSNDTGGAAAEMTFEVSGASAISAGNSRALRIDSSNADDRMRASIVDFRDSLTAGSNVFTAKYRADGGGTATFQHRRLDIIPF